MKSLFVSSTSSSEAADDKQLTKTINRYGRVDLLCIDELGYMELDRRGAELLFQVLTEREVKASVAIASNESFSGWTKTFTDPRLCAAIVDRLTFNGTIIETGTDSYRLARTHASQNACPRNSQQHDPGTADVMELAETLQLIARWLTADPERLAASLLVFIGHPAYGPDSAPRRP